MCVLQQVVPLYFFIATVLLDKLRVFTGVATGVACKGDLSAKARTLSTQRRLAKLFTDHKVAFIRHSGFQFLKASFERTQPTVPNVFFC